MLLEREWNEGLGMDALNWKDRKRNMAGDCIEKREEQAVDVAQLHENRIYF